jgi:hypothetical protein
MYPEMVLRKTVCGIKQAGNHVIYVRGSIKTYILLFELPQIKQTDYDGLEIHLGNKTGKICTLLIGKCLEN